MFLLRGYVFVCVFAFGYSSCVEEYAAKIHSCNPSLLNKLSSYNCRQKCITDILCSDEGKAVVRCMMSLLAECPELAVHFGLSNMPFNVSHLTEIVDAGALGLTCAAQSDACSKVHQCTRMMGQLKAVEALKDFEKVMKNLGSGEASPYLFFRAKTGLVCGPLRPMLMCVINELKECLEVDIDALGKQLAKAVQGALPPNLHGMHVMTFEEDTNFIMNGCRYLPKEFVEDACLEKRLKSTEFSECHADFTDAYPTEVDRRNCTAYEALRWCFTHHVEPDCGKPVSNFLAAHLPLIIEGISARCDPQQTASAFSAASAPAVTDAIVATMMGAFLIFGALM